MGSVTQDLAPYMKKLSDEGKVNLTKKYKDKKKSAGIAYLLWFFLGAHYAYLGKWGMFFLFWFTGGGMLIWWFVDALRMPGMINSANEDIATELFQKVKLLD